MQNKYENRKFLFNFFDEEGKDYEVIVVGKKSADNMFDFIWNCLRTSVMMRPIIEDVKKDG